MQTLILFDIDGTLVWGGPAKDAFVAACLEVFGTTGPIETHSFSGKTDIQITRELMTAAGLDDAAIDAGLPRLFDLYLAGLEAGLLERPMDLLPGAADLVDWFQGRAGVATGLVTGNHERGALLKLRSVALDGRFPVGGFGSDHEHRNELPGIAVRRARDHWGVPFDPSRVVVVGDTPRDVECGRWYGARTVAVCTGNFDRPALERSGADLVLETFADAAGVGEAVLELVG